MGASKSSWDASLKMRFSRWNQINDLITKETNHFTKCNKNTDQIIAATKKLDADRLNLSVSLDKPNMCLSASMKYLKS